MAAPFDNKTRRTIEKVTRDNPGLSHKEVSALLARQGVDVSHSFIYKLRLNKAIPFDFTSKRISDQVAALNVDRSEITVTFLMAKFPELDRRYAQKIAREARDKPVREPKQRKNDKSELDEGQRKLASGILTRTGNVTVHRMF
jgi:hypothetical protein